MCKDQFTLITEDPDDQVIVTLPCKHPFHEGCIMPWLKTSATCPVCRYALGLHGTIVFCLPCLRFQLVPQPASRPPDGVASGSGSPPLVNRATRPDASPSGGMLGQIFNMIGGRGNSNGSRTNRNRPPTDEWESGDPPGGWPE